MCRCGAGSRTAVLVELYEHRTPTIFEIHRRTRFTRLCSFTKSLGYPRSSVSHRAQAPAHIRRASKCGLRRATYRSAQHVTTTGLTRLEDLQLMKPRPHATTASDAEHRLQASTPSRPHGCGRADLPLTLYHILAAGQAHLLLGGIAALKRFPCGFRPTNANSDAYGVLLCASCAARSGLPIS